MLQKTVTVVNIHGIHCRPSSAIVRAAMPCKAELKVEAANGTANLKSMIEIITLAIKPEEQVTITADGEDEAEAIEKISEAFTAVYDYPDK